MNEPEITVADVDHSTLPYYDFRCSMCNVESNVVSCKSITLGHDTGYQFIIECPRCSHRLSLIPLSTVDQDTILTVEVCGSCEDKFWNDPHSPDYLCEGCRLTL